MKSLKSDQTAVRVAGICVVLSLFVGASSWAGNEAPPGAGPWEKVSNKDDILVERRTVEGSNLKEFRGRGVIDAPVARVLAVLQDAPHRHEWMSDCATSYVLEEDHGRRMQIAYHRTKAPWPVADRDSINRAEIIIDLSARRIVLPFEAIEHPKGPPVKGVVRMPFLRGHWVLSPVREGSATEVEYQVHANPGGSLPEWLANAASKKIPHHTLLGLRRQVKFREYPALEAEILGSPEAHQLFGAAAKAALKSAPAAAAAVPSAAPPPAPAAPGSSPPPGGAATGATQPQ